MKDRPHRTWLAFAAIVLATTLVVAGAVRWVPLVRGAENATHDARAAFLGQPRPQSAAIVLVTITEQTLVAFPYRSPLDRGFLADLITALAGKGVAAIGLDILLDQATEPAKDARLAAALAATPVPLVAIVADQGDGLTKAQTATLDAMLGSVETGFASLPRDPFDGIVRRHQAMRAKKSGDQPSFATALARAVGIGTPVSPSFFLDWHRGPDATTPAFVRYPAQAAAMLPDEWLAGKIVLVGADLPHSDRLRTPLSRFDNTDMPGLAVHAHALDQMLENRSGPRLSWSFEIIVLAIAAIAGVVVAGLMVPVIWSLAIGGGLVVAYWTGAFALFASQEVSLPLVAPSLGYLAAAGLASGLLNRRERARRRFLRQAFAHYLSPAVIDRLVADPNRLRLGGERREMSFVFTDIAGFTSMTESLEPNVMASVMNAYLDALCQIVIDHGGTVDKIVGDAVHGFFNAPEDQPDHAARAVRCALALDARAREFSRKQNELGIAFGGTRIGVNTGAAIVGNFGGAVFDYTAYGDVVNTTARLESANRSLGTRICVADATARQCHDQVFRPIGVLSLRGKTQGVVVLEPLGDVPDGDPDLEAYREAYTALQAGDSRGIERLAEIWPDDSLVQAHAARLRSGQNGAAIDTVGP